MTAPIRDLEDRLRHAFRAQAGRMPAPPVPPPWAPSRGPRQRSPRPWWRPPVAVTLATAVVAVAVFVVARPDHGGRDLPATVVAGSPTTADPAAGLSAAAPGAPGRSITLPPPLAPRSYLADVDSIATRPVGRASLVFGVSGRGNWTVFVGDPVNQDLRVIVELPTTGSMAVSADGAYVAFSNPVDGGQSLIGIADVRTGVISAYTRTSTVMALAFSPVDTDRLAVLETARADGRWHLSVLRRDGSTVSSGVVPRGEEERSLAWSPAGQRVAMLGCVNAPECTGTILDVARGQVLRTAQPAQWAAWIDEDRLLREQARTIAVTDATGALAWSFPVVGVVPPFPVLSADRTKVLVQPFGGGAGDPFVAVVDVRTGAVERELVAPSDGVPYIVGWHGRDVLVGRERAGRYEIVTAGTSVAAGTVVLSLPFRSEGFIPDGRRIEVAAWYAAGG